MTANPRYAGAARRLSDRIEPTWVDAFVHERSPGVICLTGPVHPPLQRKCYANRRPPAAGARWTDSAGIGSLRAADPHQHSPSAEIMRVIASVWPMAHTAKDLT